MSCKAFGSSGLKYIDSMSTANTLAGGFLALVVALGVGACFIRLMRTLPSRFGLAVSLISGAAIIDLLVALLLF